MPDPSAALYKFLDARLLCPITGLRWPMPDSARAGAWVERGGPLDPEGLGTVIVRGHELAPWVCAHLFRAEIEGDADEDDGVLIASRVRLLEPEPRWPAIAREIGTLALARVQALALQHPRLAEYATDAEQCAQHDALTGLLFIAALTRAVAADPAAIDEPARCSAFLAERALQSSWIAERLAG